VVALTVTADTNIYISALVFGGRPRELLELGQEGLIRLAVSDDILHEVRGVLREKFGWEPARLEGAMTLITSCTYRVEPTRRIEAVRDDPDDDRILECAVAAGSQVLVTGDKHLLRLGQFEGMPILTLSDFLDRRPQLGRARGEHQG
jgi:uncharacterized protein